MGIGSSLVIFAVGAVLRFAVTVTTTSFNIHTVGVILMIVGGIGFLNNVRHGVSINLSNQPGFLYRFNIHACGLAAG